MSLFTSKSKKINLYPYQKQNIGHKHKKKNMNPQQNQEFDTLFRKKLFEDDEDEDDFKTAPTQMQQTNEEDSSTCSSSEHKTSKKDNKNKVICQKTYKKIKHKIQKIQQYTEEIEALMKKCK